MDTSNQLGEHRLVTVNTKEEKMRTLKSTNLLGYFIVTIFILSSCSSSLSPEKIDELHLLGGKYYSAKNDKEAIKAWKMVVEEKPDHIEAWQNIAIVQEQEFGDFLQAENTLKEAVDKNPENSEIQVTLAKLLVRLNRENEALVILDKVISNDPTFPKAYLDRGLINFKLEKNLESVDDLKQAKKLDPQLYAINFNLGLAYEKLGMAMEANKSFEEETKVDPNNAMAFAKLGDTWNNLNRIDLAIAAYQESLRLNPYITWPYYNLGVLKESLGEDSSAKEYYIKHLALQPNNGHAWSNLGLIYIKERSLIKAIDAEKKAVQHDGNSFAFHFNLGLAYEKNKNYSDAISSYKNAQRLNPMFQASQIRIDKLMKLVSKK